MLLKGKSDLIGQLGRAVSKATTEEFLLPYIAIAQDEFIIPAIGRELFMELDTAYNAAEPNLSDAQKTLLPMLKRALAYWAYVKYLNFSLGNDGDNGLQEDTTDKARPVRIGIVDKRQRAAAEIATTALESALGLLYTYPSLYPTFKNSVTYQAIRGLLISSPGDIATYLPQTRGNYRLFLSLKPYFVEAEREIIRPTLGKELYNDVKAKWVAGICSTEEKSLVEQIAYALCAAAYHEALFHLNIVQLANGSLRVLSDFDGIYNQRNATDDQLQQAQTKAETQAAKYLTALKNFLNTNAGDYPLYANASRNTTGMIDNSQYNSIFRMHR